MIHNTGSSFTDASPLLPIEVTSPETTARMIKPKTSSMTAAPRIIRASLLFVLWRSCNTRAVMPTLVAASVAPINRCTYQPASGRNKEETP